MVPPGCSAPLRSASSIIASAMRSLIEPPGLPRSDLIQNLMARAEQAVDADARRAADRGENVVSFIGVPCPGTRRDRWDGGGKCAFWPIDSITVGQTSPVRSDLSRFPLMARPPRLSIAGLAHRRHPARHNRQPIFLDDEDRLAYRRAALRESAALHRVAVHAYVLMNDHLHLLVTPPTAEALSKMPQAIGRRYVAAFNRRHGRIGTLWDGASVPPSSRTGRTC